jgi:circadian clock protein KaiB
MGRQPRTPKGARSLRLYVAGNAPNSLSAIANAKAICEGHPGLPYELEIVDLLKHPQRALSDRIIVTPTLLRLRPLPAGRVVGNLSDTRQVLLLLGSK